MRIVEILVDRYGPLARSSITPDSGLHVIFGPNEAGKTLLLEAILRLLEPGITKTISAVLRVKEEPQGFVRAERDGNTLQYAGDGALSEDSEIKPEHLANIFVVRESDLRVLDEHSFYTSVTEHIGDLHTSTLNLIENELLTQGRLTSTRREVSSASDADHAADVWKHAQALGEEIEGYVEEAEAEGLDQIEGELLDVRGELQIAEKEVERLNRAQLIRRHYKLKDRLEKYGDHSASLRKLEAFSRGSLQGMISNQDAIDKERDRISSLQEKIDAHKESVETLEEKVAKRRDELAPLEQRFTNVGEVKTVFEQFRRDVSPNEGVGDSEKLALWFGTGGLAGGVFLQALSFVFGRGLGTVALVVTAVGISGLAGYGVLRHRRHRRESQGARLVQAAQDAGLNVERVQQIGSEIRSFEAEMQGVKKRIKDIEDAIESEKNQIRNYEDQIEESRNSLREYRGTIGAILDQVRVDSIGEYRERLEKKEDLEGERDRTKQSLIDAFGNPAGDDWKENAQSWEANLGGLIEGIKEEVGPNDYDEELHQQKQQRLEELEEEEERLIARLEEHQHRIDEFEHQLNDKIHAEPFVGRPLQLEAKTVDGLRALFRELQGLVEQIEWDAEVSQIALSVLDDLKAEEERKITDLFAADGPATEAFGRMSDGRYERVSYDPEKQTLKVTPVNGRELTPAQLSKGAREQLYLAARLGLAERVLGAEQGFFLLDDPLLPADKERLTAGFEVLRSIAAKGWQILYFTAKEEVRQGMVEEFNIPLTEFSNRL